MTDQEILKKVVEKAVKNGYDLRGGQGFVIEVETYKDLGESLGIVIDPDVQIYFITPESKGGRKVPIDTINLIFDKDFAKAFWGTEWVYTKMDYGGVYEVKTLQEMETGTVRWEAYRYHLMKMVLDSDPLKYLEQFI